jgi:lipopolysaccharide export LptBFGC system permease protein LptF
LTEKLVKKFGSFGMKIYSRYVFWQAIKWLAIMLLIFVFVMIFGLIVQSVLGGLPLNITFLILPSLLPQSLSYAAPFATLFAMGIAFLPMVQRGEIIALKVIGVPLWKALLPVYIALLGVSLLSVKFNDVSTSTARDKRNQTILNSFEKIIVSQLRKEKIYIAPNSIFTIEVSDVLEDGTLINPYFQFKKKDISALAERAKLGVQYRVDNPLIVVDFYNTEVTESNSEVVLPQDFHLEVPLNEIYKKKARVDPQASEAPRALAKLEKERDAYHRQMAAKSSFALLCGNVDEASTKEWQARRGHERYFERQHNLYRLVSPRNWASGFTCFFFAWAMIPLTIHYPKIAIETSKTKFYLPTLIVIPVLLLLLYYLLWGIFYDGTKRGDFHPYFIWVGDVALGIVGAIYLKKIH